METVTTFLAKHKGKIKIAVAFVLGGLTAVGVKVPEFVAPLLAALGVS